jgi:hypothetical protein
MERILTSFKGICLAWRLSITCLEVQVDGVLNDKVGRVICLNILRKIKDLLKLAGKFYFFISTRRLTNVLMYLPIWMHKKCVDVLANKFETIFIFFFNFFFKFVFKKLLIFKICPKKLLTYIFYLKNELFQKKVITNGL